MREDGNTRRAAISGRMARDGQGNGCADKRPLFILRWGAPPAQRHKRTGGEHGRRDRQAR